MINGDWFLIAVIIVAFIAGYSAVSFIVKKIYTEKQTTTTDKKKNGRSQHQEANSESWESQSEEDKYARVLGLSTIFTATEVKRAYRELLFKYHPDKVNHLGTEFKSIAEEKTREIVKAYDYFRKKLNIN